MPDKDKETSVVPNDTETEPDSCSIAANSTSIPLAILHKPSKFLLAHQAISRPFRKASTFPKFSLLPFELRSQIWEAAIVPRVHELHPCSKLYNERMTFRSNSSLTPPILHACHESRILALKYHQLMDYQPPGDVSHGKGILRFYFNPDLDTLLLNSLMGLFVMFMLLEDEEEFLGLTGLGIMKGWQRVAFDAERAQLITLLSGNSGSPPQPRFKSVFPALRELTIAFDCNSKGKTRFRTSVWPGENGTSLTEIPMPSTFPYEIEGTEERDTLMEAMVSPMKQFLESEFKTDTTETPGIVIAKVKRKMFIRGDIRYAFRKMCAMVGLKPRGVFRRI
ncbi:hypothetical protein BUE80_DR000948 [Diplocarpon rosae]|nr:hypothetical protein BUE80_DR000948 [Diplocarpon rosae]